MVGLLLLAATFSVLWSNSNAEDKCKGELGRCLAGLPLEGHGGLPVSQEQISALCRAYKKGMECVESWNKECLSTESRLMAEKQMASAQLFMGLLCSEGEFKKEYLNHTECFGGVTKDWDRCNEKYQEAVREVNDRGVILSYTQRTIDFCCARFGFNRCVSYASRAKCDRGGAVMLRRISETLSNDRRCERFDPTPCSAGGLIVVSKHNTTILFALVLSVLLYNLMVKQF